MSLMETMIVELFEEICDTPLPTPFPRLTYENSLENAERNNCKHIAVFQGDASLLSGKKYDIIILSDIGANSLLLHPEVWFNGGTIPNRLKLIEEFVLDASYVSLREITFQYSFPKSVLSKLPFTGAQIAIVGRNLAYLVEHMQGLGISPEAAFSTQSGAQGSESYTSPSTRSIGFNIKLDF